MNDPTTPDEWQDAVDAADFLLLVDSARQYGLIDGGDTVNADRCWDLLWRGMQQGIFPSPPDRRRAWLGRYVRQERDRVGISQQALARKVNMSAPWISMVERGKAEVDAAMWARLTAALAS